jgi:hypothetical protein
VNIRTRTSALLLAATVATSAGVLATPASAQSLHQGKPYGCQINPNAQGCNTTPVTTPPSTLPSTGGAANLPGSNPAGGLLAALGLLLTGFALRMHGSRRHS